MRFDIRGGAVAAALMAAALTSPARADDPPPAQSATPAQLAAPAQVDMAKKILIAVGLKASMDQIVPVMLGQLQGQMVQIHPEMGKALHETLVALEPEFEKGEDSVFTDTAQALASRLTPADLQQTLSFVESEAGRKYTLAQAAVLNALGASGAAWRQQLTTVMLDRTREEMKKKGYTF